MAERTGSCGTVAALNDDFGDAGHRGIRRLPAAALRHRRLRRPARGPRSIGDRQQLDLLAVPGGLLHRLDLFRQRRPGGGVRDLVPADLSRADAGDASCLDRRSQDDPDRPDLPDHLDRGLHRQPLRQEPDAGGAGHGDHRGRHRSLHRVAAQGGVRRLSPAHHRPRASQSSGDRLVAGRHAVRDVGAGGVHDDLRHAPPRQCRAARGNGCGRRLRVGRQARRLRRRWQLRDLGPLRRHG